MKIPEYKTPAESKEALVRRIALQRERFILRSENKKERSVLNRDSRHSMNGAMHNIVDQTVNYIQKNPKASLFYGVGSVVALSLAIKCIGAKRLIKSGGVILPLLIAYLEDRGDDK